jgi:ferredoxin-NADP reductase
VYTLTRPNPEWHGLTGRIDVEFIRKHVPDTSQQMYFVCGPNALVDAMRAALATIGVDAGQIKHEAFPGYESASAAVSVAAS